MKMGMQEAPSKYKAGQVVLAFGDAINADSMNLWFRKLVIAYDNHLQGFTSTPVILTAFWDSSEYHF